MPIICFLPSTSITTLDASGNPASLGSTAQGTAAHLAGGTITLNSADLVAFEALDTDPNFDDSDSSQVIGDPMASGLTSGQDFEAEYIITLEDSQGTQYRVIGLSVGPGFSNVVGLMFFDGMPPIGETLSIVATGEGAGRPGIETVPYDDLLKVICFTPGTMIETETGSRPIESLKAGDRILTRDHGYQRLHWIGCSDLGPAQLSAQPDLRPVLLRKDCFGPGQPARDMLVSPQHRLMLESRRARAMFGSPEVLAAAATLIDDGRIVRAAGISSVRYVHLLFDRHQLVRSDGLWTESFQPHDATLDALSTRTRDEIFAIFPELRCRDFGTLAHPARPVLKPHEVALLA